MADQAVVCAQERCEENLPTRIQAPAASGRGARTPNGAPTRRHLRGKTMFWIVYQLGKKTCLCMVSLHTWSPQVLVCVLSYGLDHEDWPRVVSDDIHRHLERLRNKVVTLRGLAEGRTLLPLPLNLERARLQRATDRSASSTAGVSTATCRRTWWEHRLWLIMDQTAQTQTADSCLYLVALKTTSVLSSEGETTWKIYNRKRLQKKIMMTFSDTHSGIVQIRIEIKVGWIHLDILWTPHVT